MKKPAIRKGAAHAAPTFKLIRTRLMQAGAIAAAIVSIAAAWHLFNLDTPAWSSDLRKANARQADTAIDVYTKAIRDDTILRSQINDPTTKALIDDRLNEYNSKLLDARERKIELGK